MVQYFSCVFSTSTYNKYFCTDPRSSRHPLYIKSRLYTTRPVHDTVLELFSEEALTDTISAQSYFVHTSIHVRRTTYILPVTSHPLVLLRPAILTQI